MDSSSSSSTGPQSGKHGGPFRQKRRDRRNCRLDGLRKDGAGDEHLWKIIRKNISGTIEKDGRELYIRHPEEAIKNGIVYVTEDRKGNGLILDDSIKENITLSKLEKVSSRLVMDERRENMKRRIFAGN